MKKFIQLFVLLLFAINSDAQDLKIINKLTLNPLGYNNIYCFTSDDYGNNYCAVEYRGVFQFDTFNYNSIKQNLILIKTNKNNIVKKYLPITSVTNLTSPNILTINNKIYVTLSFNDSITFNQITYYNPYPQVNLLIIKLDTNLIIEKVEKLNGVVSSFKNVTKFNSYQIMISSAYNCLIDTNFNTVSKDSIINTGFSSITSPNGNSFYSTAGVNKWNPPVLDSIVLQGTLPNTYGHGYMIIRHRLSDHKPLWALSLNAENPSFGGGLNSPRLSSDGNNNIIVAGGYDNSKLQLHDGSYLTPLMSGNGTYVIKYDSNGVILWKDFCINGSIYALDIDSNNDIYVAGQMYYYSDTGINVFGGIDYEAKGGLFIGKYSSTGQELWSFVFNDSFSNGGAQVSQIKVFAPDSFAIAGNYSWDSCKVDTTTIYGVLYKPNSIYMVCKVANNALQIPINNTSNNKFSITPNPAATSITISADAMPKLIRMINTFGQVIYAEMPKTNFMQIPISHLPNGIFYAQAIWQNGYMHTQKFIKN
jgi:hypothetical protein